MKKKENNIPTSDHAAIPSDNVQFLIDRRIAYLIEKEKEEVRRIKSETKENEEKKDIAAHTAKPSVKNTVARKARNILANALRISKKLSWLKQKAQLF